MPSCMSCSISTTQINQAASMCFCCLYPCSAMADWALVNGVVCPMGTADKCLLVQMRARSGGFMWGCWGEGFSSEVAQDGGDSRAMGGTQENILHLPLSDLHHKKSLTRPVSFPTPWHNPLASYCECVQTLLGKRTLAAYSVP